ncbi:carboxypeptidase regulatory-like domain-containing protein [Candidatus Palauibacter sp.]|uniref:carboxypeptidase regulatory-like domain-containing protein n=1 Tax=Candidatus Palauibacter sp. TaxID=3101350 RepID=UPI003AF26FE2
MSMGNGRGLPRPLKRLRVPGTTPSRFRVLASTVLLLGVGADPALALQALEARDESCGDRASLAITVRDDSGQIPIPNATVALRWTDAVRRPVREAADVGGELLLCVPPDAAGATLWAEFADASSEEQLVVLEPGMKHAVELRLLVADIRTGRLIGRILDARTGRPVAAAAVSVPYRAEVVDSNRMGRFIVSGLPVGELELSVRHLGYAPLTHAVTVRHGFTTEVEIGLSADPVEVAPLVATVERPRRLEIKGFYERKYWGELTGLGTFITADYIERWHPNSIGRLVADLVPSIRCHGGRGCILANSRMSAGFSNRPCPMSVYLDGILLRGASVDEFALPIEVAGIEVYKGPASLPAEFSGSASRCGAVVVWTK